MSGFSNAMIKTDCIDFMQNHMENNSVQLTVTDIPYDVVNRESNGLRNLDKGNADICTFDLDTFVSEVVRVTSGSIYIFCSSEQLSFIRSKLIQLGLTTRLIIWEKSNPSPMNGQHIWLSGVELCVYGKKRGGCFNEFCKNTVFKFPCGRNKIHPTQKPIMLINELVRASSNEGDVVFDPCMGSGTTCISAFSLDRRFVGLELDNTYYDAAVNRLKQAGCDDLLQIIETEE